MNAHSHAQWAREIPVRSSDEPLDSRGCPDGIVTIFEDDKQVIALTARPYDGSAVHLHHLADQNLMPFYRNASQDRFIFPELSATCNIGEKESHNRPTDILERNEPKCFSPRPYTGNLHGLS